MNKEELLKLKNYLKGVSNKKTISLSLAMILLLSGCADPVKDDLKEKDKTIEPNIATEVYNDEPTYTTLDLDYKSTDKPITKSEDITYDYDESVFDKPATEVNWNESLNIYFEGDEAKANNELTIEEMFEEVRIAYGLTCNQLDDICAVLTKESFYMYADFDGNTFENGADCEDAKNATSILINRLHDTRYTRQYGYNIYKIMVNGGFQPYQEGTYLKYKGRIDLRVYQEVIKTLHSQKPANDRLEFRAPLKRFTEAYAGEYIQPVNGGNIYIIPTSENTEVDYEFRINNGKQLILR